MVRRRTMLVGIAALASGGGAAVASGAFSTVEAQRDVQLQTTGDSAALLSLAPAGSGTIVQVQNDLVGFDIANINREARTTFRPAFQVTNNGANSVNFYVQAQTNVGDGLILDFEENGTEASIVGSAQAIQILSGGSAQIDIAIDLIGQAHTDLEAITTVTIVAEAVA